MAQKKRSRRFLPYLIVTVFVMAAALIFGWNHFCRPRLEMVRYSAFGINMPKNYRVHGIDVSRYQRWINWNLVSAMRVDSIAIDFCFIKATEGENRVDPFFSRNWKAVKQTRIVRGAYHYFRARQDAVAQANAFIRQVRLQPGDLPPVLDIEELDGVSPARMVDGVRQWIKRIEKHYGVKPILYAGSRFYTTYLEDQFPEQPIWVAHYYKSFAPRLNRSWMFWQHNDRGRVDGISHLVDFNVFAGPRSEFDKIRIL